MSQQAFSIKIKGKTYSLSFEDVSDIDLTALTEIHFGNLVGEMVVTPGQLNQLGILVAQLESEVLESKLNKDIVWAQVLKDTFLNLKEANPKFTADIIEASAKADPTFVDAQRRLGEVESALSMVKNTYWALKDKSSKIEKLTMGLSEDEFKVNFSQLRAMGANISEVSLR